MPKPLPNKAYPAKTWDKARRLSRAGLSADMAEIKGLLHQLMGQAGHANAPVTGRVDSQKPLNTSG
jgi:hypothetical protein